MKKTGKKSNVLKNIARIGVVVAIAAVGTYLLTFSRAATGDATLLLKPASGSVTKDTNISVGIYENSGNVTVNAVTFGLTYDTAKFQFVSVSNTGGSFTNCPESSGSNGLVRVTCFINPPNTVTNERLIATAVFKAVTTGSTALNFTSDSEISQSGTGVNIWNGNTSGGSYTLAAPAQPPQPPTNNPQPPTTPSTPTTPTTPSTPRSGGGGGNTSRPTTPSNPTTTPTTPSSPTEVTTPNETATQPQLGGIVAITIMGPDGKPVPGVSVTLNKQTVVTDNEGVASFIGIAPGKYELEAKGVLGAATKEITVTDTSASSPVTAQEFALTLKKPFNWPLYAGIAIVVALAIALIVLGKRWLQHRPSKGSGRQVTGGIVVNGVGTDPDAAPVQPLAPSVPETKPLHETQLKTAPDKAAVKDTDTLSEIERKVGADKVVATKTVSKKPEVAVETIMENPEDKTVKADAKGDTGTMITPTRPPSDPIE